MSKMSFTKQQKIIAAIVLVLLVGGGAYALVGRNQSPQIVQPPSQKPKKQVNLIPLEERPYVTLQPLSSRNLLQVTIGELKKPAKSVEITLEYDRNKGVLDAVLNSFSLDKTPLVEQMFLGSKSAGGHTTYHDDVIGGTMTLDFTNEDYALEVPWRYDDTKTSYQELSTSDGKFQATLTNPIKESKVLIMQSPGLPAKVDNEVLSGPYFIGTVGDLPASEAQLKFRLTDVPTNATVMAWDGTQWVTIESTIEDKTVSAAGKLYSTYVVTK